MRATALGAAGPGGFWLVCMGGHSVPFFMEFAEGVMTLTITQRAAVTETRLPVAELAGQLRLPDGWETVPGQFARLVGRLGAALEIIEGRAGCVLMERELTLEGRAPGGRLLSLPCAPVAEVVSLTVDGVALDLTGAVLERDGDWTRVCLAQALVAGAQVRITVRAGPGDWGDMPIALSEAILLKAEALETLTDDKLEGQIEWLVRPHRRLRIGRG